MRNELTWIVQHADYRNLSKIGNKNRKAKKEGLIRELNKTNENQGGGKVDQAVPAHRGERASGEEVELAPCRRPWGTFGGELGRVRQPLVKILSTSLTLRTTISSNCIIKVWARQGCRQLLLARVGKKVHYWRRNIAPHVVCLRFPKITVSSCTPGYIATDLTKDFLVKQGKTAKEAGMKTPAEVIPGQLMAICVKCCSFVVKLDKSKYLHRALAAQSS